MNQKTISKEFSVTGIGLHSGVDVSMTVKPADINSGIVFRRADLNPVVDIKVIPSSIKEAVMCTLLTKDGDQSLSVSTIEHLMSAFAMFEIDNVLIEVNAPELPVMDGSSYEFTQILTETGIQKQSAPRQGIKILKPVRVEHEDKFAEVLPSDTLTYEFKIEWDHPVIAATNDHIVFKYDLDEYIEMVSKARTFGFYEQLEYLHQNNLAKGASLDNAVGISNEGVLNDGGLRYDDEFVRHKLLDAIGDFYVGGYIEGHFNCYKSGHTLNNKLLHAIFADESAWTYI
ncbi:UDP-3-O-acyl-N-acetylglucosamine deacetylase [Francisella adeliensis]|uniref:UDP-3-O-acyl-N-acetylglucosamine deacetylase n=1 Tax=Francisella adeliensis TaxID=2007306 RepID=A0A2Z4XW51_9GAMM|nr:UDP-3-O-acyl-N-acetylglucosamine deacetylase [Francisella adeliensis]AXA33067.1 UDP-3-O-[3-hydroxymyristoyl] N-acetylglucosamine deacetylase [Francisella adeliensis]MBK2086043.1 UDP-3-O-acyl-N-acetylglucosamine deacetylase [Francisella adeliensis]MBK2096793.1 UDP-3-O-acyl-N-acetylglucosamine deacetylase [Francisella adeliensis]QIW11295.1 UDP-3-O-acyl-N-acetylglucosamine deacetylase [Francisella adeliensis]QIW13170.1 UDP-3-O-acyl-N-acetylglucosamine deacetylase [Francisella adeliensis]